MERVLTNKPLYTLEKNVENHDETTGEEFFKVHTIIYVGSIPITGIYTSAEHFTDIRNWHYHKLGEKIMNKINEEQYRNHMTFVLLDSTENSSGITHTSPYPDDCIEFVAKKIKKYDHYMEDTENVKVFTACLQCRKLITIGFQFGKSDQLNKCCLCTKCLAKFNTPGVNQE